MSRTRMRMAALTCALATATAGATTVAADASPAPTATSAASPAARGTSLPGLSRLLATGTPSHKAIVTFDEVPTAGQVLALRGLGLKVQPLRALPLAIVAGPTAKLVKAAGIGNDVYPDETLQYTDTTSTDAMREPSSSPSWRAIATRAACRSRGGRCSPTSACARPRSASRRCTRRSRGRRRSSRPTGASSPRARTTRRAA